MLLRTLLHFLAVRKELTCLFHRIPHSSTKKHGVGYESVLATSLSDLSYEAALISLYLRPGLRPTSQKCGLPHRLVTPYSFGNISNSRLWRSSRELLQHQNLCIFYILHTLWCHGPILSDLLSVVSTLFSSPRWVYPAQASSSALFRVKKAIRDARRLAPFR